MIVSRGLSLRASLYFFFFSFPLGISVQLKDTHSCLLILLAKPQPQTILRAPKRFWQLWHRTYGSCGKMCWQAPCRPHPAITYVENLMPDSSCCVEAAQYHTNQSCLILSFPFPVSTCCFLCLFIFYFPFLHLRVRLEVLWGGDHHFVLHSVSCHGVCLPGTTAMKTVMPNNTAGAVVPGRLHGEWPENWLLWVKNTAPGELLMNFLKVTWHCFAYLKVFCTAGPWAVIYPVLTACVYCVCLLGSC